MRKLLRSLAAITFTLYCSVCFALDTNELSDQQIKQLQFTAGKGDATAAAALGTYFLAHNPDKLEEAGKLLRQAADAGNADGMYGLGMMYQMGRGMSPNLGEAVKFFQQAAEKGQPQAQMSLGIYYSEGIGVQRNVDQAFKLLSESAPKVPGAGRTALGMLYANGWGVKRDLNEAAKWLKMAVTDGDTNAVNYLEFLTAIDQADKGNVQAQYAVATTYYKANKEPFFVEARQWLTKAAESGYVPAEAALGTMISRGQGGPQDAAECAKWFLKAAEGGDVQSAANIGVLCVAGRGVTQNLTEGKRWLELAAQLQSDVAELQLALMYEQGIGYQQNPRESLKWAKRAGEHGNPNAHQVIDRITSAMNAAGISLVHYDALTLKGISGPAQKRLALINNQTFGAGESANVQLGDGKVAIKCLEIRESSVLVQFDKSGEKKELFLNKK